jgi:NADH-quinone oxidoreductase subunit F
VCKLKCPADAISGTRKETHEIDQAVCTKCGSCLDVCKFGAIRKTTGAIPLDAASHLKPVHERAGARGN